tara:strand:- start:406 stop:693 length:288 start_codon:yes stop_codon:yes gene_type:complete
MAKKKKPTNLFHFIFGVVVVMLFLVGIISVNSNCNSLNAEIDDLNREQAFQRNRLSNLKLDITRLSRSDRIREVAVNKLNMIRPNIESIDIVISD